MPTLWPNAQLHYSVFSARAGADSAALAVALAAPGYTAQLVVVYAACGAGPTRVRPPYLRPICQRMTNC